MSPSFFVLGALCSIDAIMLYKVDLTWYFALCVLVPLLGTGRWRFPNILNTFCAIGLITAVLIGGIVGDRMDKGLTYGGKLSLILFVLWPLFRANARSVHLYLIGVTVVVCVNACLIFLSAGWGLPTASLTGDGRWQTVLSEPGAMGVPAVVVFSYWFLRIVSIKLTASASVLALTGLSVAIASGSRGIIVLCAAAILMSAVVVVLRRRVNLILMGVGLLLGSVLVLMLALPDLSFIENRIPSRLSSFALALRGNPNQFADSDPERTQLMLRAIEGIRDHPVLGSGLYSMAHTTSTGEPIVVHNRYLSAWAEMGLLGFVALCGTTFLWLRALPAAIDGIRAEDPCCGFKCLWSITILLQFGIFGLFFPIGVQIDDWGLFMTAETILTATVGDRANRKVTALSRVPPGSLPDSPQCPSYPTCVPV